MPSILPTSNGWVRRHQLTMRLRLRPSEWNLQRNCFSLFGLQNFFHRNSTPWEFLVFEAVEVLRSSVQADLGGAFSFTRKYVIISPRLLTFTHSGLSCTVCSTLLSLSLVNHCRFMHVPFLPDVLAHSKLLEADSRLTQGPSVGAFENLSQGHGRTCPCSSH